MTGRRKQQTTLNDRLRELEQAVGGARAREREIGRQHEAAQAEVARLGEARIDAFAAGDEPTAERLAGERGDAEQAVAELAERLEGARRAVHRADVELSTFAASNLEGLLAERLPQAQAAVEAVTSALDALRTAHSRWTAIEADSMRLLRLAGRQTDTQPRFPSALGALVRDARRVDSDVPLPLPTAMAAL